MPLEYQSPVYPQKQISENIPKFSNMTWKRVEGFPTTPNPRKIILSGHRVVVWVAN